jgi:hypothetical protein
MHRLVSFLLVLLAGCGRCGGGPGNAKAAEEILPAQLSGAAVTVPLGLLAEHAATLADRAASLPGGEQIADFRKGLAARLGFDPFTREGLVSAGIDPDRGAALGLLPDSIPSPVAVALPLANPDKFMETAQRLLVERAGFSPGGGSRLAKTFVRQQTQIGLAIVRGYGLVVRAPDAGAVLAQAEQRKASESLGQNAGLSAMRKKLGGQDLLLYAPAGSELPARRGLPQSTGDAALGITTSAQGAALRLVAQLPPDAAARAQAALPGGGAWLVGLLPSDAVLRARLGVSAPQLLALMRQVPEVAEILAKVDPSEVLAALAPGAAVSVSVAKTANLSQLVDNGLDWRVESPFQTVQLVALAQIADEGRFQAGIESLVKQLPAAGAQVARKGNDFQITYSAGQGARFGWREIEGKKVAYVLGGSIAPEDLHRAPEGKDPEAAALKIDTGAALRADFGKLREQIHALPLSTYGSGPQSYVTQSLVGQVIDPLGQLRVSMGAMPYPDSLGATLDLEIAAQ